MGVEKMLLAFAAVSIAVIHSLAPDHYVPFVAIGKARMWGVKKILAFSTLAGTLHVLSSVAIGILLIFGINLLGFAEAIESLSPILLIAVGLAYSIASLIKPHKHTHTSATVVLLALSLSPCIPLIPIMLATRTYAELLIVTTLYGVSTISTIVTLTYLSSKAFKPPKIIHGKEDFLAGLIIALTGLLNYVFKLYESDEA